jgi:ribosomal protein S18 acetylase RimI-like enzyme
MKYLIDTNVFIPLEPTGPDDVGALTSRAASFAQKANRAGSSLFIHPAQSRDISNDQNNERRQLRETLLGKYPALPEPPSARRIESVLGSPPIESHDWVDHQLLAALQADAVDYLVTEDAGIHRKGKRLGLQHRVTYVADAIAALEALFDTVPANRPAIEALVAHSLDSEDPIFVSVRAEYPDFDNWLIKCKREHRRAWVIPAPDKSYAAASIVNREDRADFGFGGKTLKICMFKVSDIHSGFRYGELLLRHLLHHAEQNEFVFLFVEVFPRHQALIALFGEFGFFDLGINTERGELRLGKKLTFTVEDLSTLDPLEFNRRFGPSAIKWTNVSGFIVPIKPKYHDMLFPEATPQAQLFEGQTACGNALRKAYLCNSGSREIKPGGILAFYRSEDAQALTESQKRRLSQAPRPRSPATSESEPCIRFVRLNGCAKRKCSPFCSGKRGFFNLR